MYYILRHGILYMVNFMKKIKMLLIVCLIIALIPVGINFLVIFKSKDKIFGEKGITKTYDIALVLGCSALKNGSPNKMLRDRLNTAIDLYNNKKAKKVLISGDHTKTYSEITSMFNYLIENNIPEEDILIDYAGYSTGESLINYQKNYSEHSVIVVTQKYHLYRALFIASELELNARGVFAKLINYNGQTFREIREILARNKDFVIYGLIK